MNVQPILDCSISNFKLKYEQSGNIKEDCVNTVLLNLCQIKQGNFFGTPGRQNNSPGGGALVKTFLQSKPIQGSGELDHIKIFPGDLPWMRCLHLELIDA